MGNAGLCADHGAVRDVEEVHEICLKDKVRSDSRETAEKIDDKLEMTIVDRPLDPEPNVEERASDKEVQSMLDQARSEWENTERLERLKVAHTEWESDLEATRSNMRQSTMGFGRSRQANRYGNRADLPVFEHGKHIPVLGLINPTSGAMAGMDILRCCKATPYYQERMFNIMDVVKGQRRGGLLDVFRIELMKAKDEAKLLKTRPRIISGGGDGTGSFVLFIVFLALKADPSREADGLGDTGNGFIWTNEELAESFPAIAQMPLGSANDFANILGWGQKYPGEKPVACLSHSWSARMLQTWFESVISPNSQVVNFDIWGIVPEDGQTSCNFKIAELTGDRGRCPNEKIDGERALHLKVAGKPVPLFVCLYFSTGFGAYMTARFQLNRRKTPFTNRLEYVRQAAGIIAEKPPPQMHLRLENVEVDCEGEAYFPPRRQSQRTRGRGYREVGFYNINWQAHALHGADRASIGARLCSSRQPVTFNDGRLDMFRWKFKSLLKNPGLRVQTDKKKDMKLAFKGGKGRGVFFQWDGEARFAFSPTGEDFSIFIRQAMVIPVVLGPFHSKSLTGPVDNGQPVRFAFCGETLEQREQIRQRVLMNVRGELDQEVNATREDIEMAQLPLRDPLRTSPAPPSPVAEIGASASPNSGHLETAASSPSAASPAASPAARSTAAQSPAA